MRILARKRSRLSGLNAPFGKRTIVRKPDDMVVSRHARFLDTKLSDQLITAAIDERRKRLEARRRKREVPVDQAALRARRLAALQMAGKLKPKLKILREALPHEKWLAIPPEDKKARRLTVRGSLWLWVVLFGALGLGYLIYTRLPENIRAGGLMVAVLIALGIILFVIVLERLWTIRGAKGRESLAVFVKKIQAMIQNNDLEGALDECRRQKGALANVIYAGVEAFMATEHKEMTDEERMDETRRGLEEANALETPLLERNLVFLSTIASIATMTGLTGTTRGMIRAFAAMSKTGMPDATQLALGISEALWNTLLGLVIAQVGIIMFNYFSTRVDHYNFMMDETVHEILQMLSRKERTVVA